MGTVARQKFLPFTFDKKNDNGDQINIPSRTQKVNYQATHDHNSGSGSTRGNSRRLTCSAYSSGISSTVNLSVSSQHHERACDYVCARPADLTWYGSKNLTYYEQLSHGFQHLAGEKDSVLEGLAKFDRENPNSDFDARDAEVQRLGCDGRGHMVALSPFLEHNIEPVTAAQLDNAWWTNRAFTQTSSNAYGQLKLLLPSIGENNELREEFEIVAEYANLTRLLRSGNDVDSDNDDGGDDDNRRPTLDVPSEMRSE